jgi:protein SCO1/2
MNKKALYGILVALFLPLTCYFILKHFTDGATVMPRHFVPDSIITTTKNGKLQSDTIWHTLPDYSFTNQAGEKVKLSSFSDKIIVADFFFTHCPTICPRLTENMKSLQTGVRRSTRPGETESDFVQFLSISIDPARDSVPQLKKWADRYQINPQSWSLLTGSREDIYRLSNKDMNLNAVDGANVDSNFMHTDFFVLIDRHRKVRGYYHNFNEDKSTDTASMARLFSDIVLLSLEKEPGRTTFLSGKLELIAIVFAMVGIGLVLMITFLNKEKKSNEPYSDKK